MGHLIPAGTGFPAVREIKLVELGEQVGTSLVDEPEIQRRLDRANYKVRMSNDELATADSSFAF